MTGSCKGPISFPDDDQFPLVVKRGAVDALTLVTRCDEETQFFKEEMANAITTFFNECLILESRLSTLRSCEHYETSNLLKGLFSVLKRDLNYERVHLSTACNLFNQYCKGTYECCAARHNIHMYHFSSPRFTT